MMDLADQNQITAIQNLGKIEFLNFSLSIDGIQVLRDIDLVFKTGQLTIIYGQRGAGKSTLLRSILALNREIYPNVSWTGDLKINGKSITTYDRKTLRTFITYIEPGFVEALDKLRLDEFIEITLREKPDSIDEFAADLDRLGLLQFMKKDIKTPLKNFYTMEKILILLFAAIVRRSFVIVLDCILDHVDDETIEPILKELLRLKEDRIIILSTRHRMRFLPIADLYVSLKNGTIEYKGSTRDLVFKR
ncbi:ATP-binding cassette domain-containing protein [Pseudothermotoga thermarum]|nr:ATP-binding cassette domain-containing protein [Pseudothermotoga thermarum]